MDRRRFLRCLIAIPAAIATGDAVAEVVDGPFAGLHGKLLPTGDCTDGHFDTVVPDLSYDALVKMFDSLPAPPPLVIPIGQVTDELRALCEIEARKPMSIRWPDPEVDPE